MIAKAPIFKWSQICTKSRIGIRSALSSSIIQDWWFNGILDNLYSLSWHSCIYLCTAENEQYGPSSSISQCPQAISWPWPCCQAGHKCKLENKKLPLWWWEKWVELGHILPFAKNSTQSQRALKLIAIVVLKMAHSLPLYTNNQEYSGGQSDQYCLPLEKYDKDFDMLLFCLVWIVTRQGSKVQFVHNAKTRSKLVKQKVTQFMGKMERKKYPMSVLNYMSW